MIAAVFEGNGKLVLKDRPLPRIAKPTDVLLEVQGVGICGTDLHILQIPPAHPATVGATLGHEFTGVVVETGSAVTEVHPATGCSWIPTPDAGSARSAAAGIPTGAARSTRAPRRPAIAPRSESSRTAPWRATSWCPRTRCTGSTRPCLRTSRLSRNRSPAW